MKIKIKDENNQIVNNFEGIGEVVNQRFPARSTTEFTFVMIF
jgi:hypothetical protein